MATELAVDSQPLPVPHGRMASELWWCGIAVVLASALSVLDASSSIAVFAAVATFSVSLQRLDVGLGVLVASVPVQDAWPAIVAGRTLTWTRLALISVIAAWLARWLLGRERLVLRRTTWWLAAYCAVLAASGVVARDVYAWAAETYRWVVALVVLVIASGSSRTAWRPTPVVAGLVAGVGVSAVVAIGQVGSGQGPASFAYRGVLRAYGFFGEPNPLAAYLEMALLPLIGSGLWLVASKPFFRWPLSGTIVLLAAALGTGTLALTQSRGGALGFVAGSAVMAWVRWPKWGRRVIVATSVLLLVAIGTPPAAPIRALFGFDAIGGPVQVTAANFAAQERLAHWGAAMRMWLDHPVLGVGAGNFSERYWEYTPTWRFRISRGHAHSAYLQAAAQSGSLGLLSYVGTMIAASGACLRAAGGSTDRFQRGFALGAAGATVAAAVHGVFDYVHVLSLGIVLSVLWGYSHAERTDLPGEAVSHGDRRATAE